ncbi:response regulator, partial [Pleurocapsa sp. CCALA 161]|uniref:response regulator n=1 Tax=Pleurocapsa sp. CCALA 161 TaxID=2107688 RepID=UPI0011B1E045
MKKLMAARELNNILIVDDTPQNLHLLVDLLTQYDYKVRPVPNGKLALSAAEINPPDLILLDVMMPDLNGYEVCKQLKTNPKTKDIPVIFISAGNEAVDKVRAFAIGGADYISKPFQIHEVLMRIKNQLAVKSLQKLLKAKNEQLRKTIIQLKESQKQEFESQQNLALAKITSGISQQINTPVAEINHTLDEIRQFGKATLQNIPFFLAQMSPPQQKYFATLLKQAQDNQINPLLSDLARQELKNLIVAKLARFEIKETAKIADVLIKMGFNEEIEDFLPLFASENYWEILDNASLIINLDKKVNNITDSTLKISKLISAFEDYAYHSYSKTPKRLANLENILEKALKSIAHLPPGVQIIKRYSPVSTINCYPEALQKACFHLLQNAIEAIGTHGILTINLYQKQNYLMVDLIDTGASISQDLLDKLCDPFFTTKSADGKAGLGLAIAKQIIEQHDGSIAVQLLSGKMT